MAAFSQTTFSNAFSSKKMFEFRLQFHWSLFLRVQLTIFQHWFRKWLVADQATSHYLTKCWLVHWRIYASLGLNDWRPGATDNENRSVIKLSPFFFRCQSFNWTNAALESSGANFLDVQIKIQILHWRNACENVCKIETISFRPQWHSQRSPM